MSVVDEVVAAVILRAGLRGLLVGVAVSVAVADIMMANRLCGLRLMMVVLVVQQCTEEMLCKHCDEHQPRNHCYGL